MAEAGGIRLSQGKVNDHDYRWPGGVAHVELCPFDPGVIKPEATLEHAESWLACHKRCGDSEMCQRT
jgi:hypothetical protein